MNPAADRKLYSPALLSLATELASYPYMAALDFHASERSRTCGSTIELGISLDANGRVGAIGMRVAACAVGQASAALLARSIEGMHADQINDAYRKITAWLGEAGELPDWPEFELLEAARPYTGRHGALVLPWKAACSALCNRPAAS